MSNRPPDAEEDSVEDLAMAYGAEDDRAHDYPETRDWCCSARKHSSAMVDQFAIRLCLPHVQGIYGLIEERVLRVMKVAGHLAWVYGEGPNVYLGTTGSAVAYRVDGKDWDDTGRPSRPMPGTERNEVVCIESLHRRLRPAWAALVFGGEDAAAVATQMHTELVGSGQYPWRPILLAASTQVELPRERIDPQDTITIYERRGCERAIERLVKDPPCQLAVVELPEGAKDWSDALVKGLVSADDPLSPLGPADEFLDERDRRPSPYQHKATRLLPETGRSIECSNQASKCEGKSILPKTP